MLSNTSSNKANYTLEINLIFTGPRPLEAMEAVGGHSPASPSTLAWPLLPRKMYTIMTRGNGPKLHLLPWISLTSFSTNLLIMVKISLPRSTLRSPLIRTLQDDPANTLCLMPVPLMICLTLLKNVKIPWVIFCRMLRVLGEFLSLKMLWQVY